MEIDEFGNFRLGLHNKYPLPIKKRCNSVKQIIRELETALTGIIDNTLKIE